MPQVKNLLIHILVTATAATKMARPIGIMIGLAADMTTAAVTAIPFPPLNPR